MINVPTLPPNTRLHYDDFGTDKYSGFTIRTKHMYLIWINTQVSDADQLKALEHEIYHIEHDHFGMIERGEATMDQIEYNTHAILSYE